MLLCDKIDLDLEDEKDVFVNAKETIAYLSNVVKTIEARVLDGELISGLKVVEGRKSRKITDGGYLYIEKQFGKNYAYETVTKPLTLTKIEALIGKIETKSMEDLGLIENKSSTKKVVLEEEE